MVIAGYVLGNVLGEGAFALTRIGYKELTPDQPVAVKSILRSHPRFNYEEIQKEIAIMQKIQHPRCVNLIEVTPSASVSLRARSLALPLPCACVSVHVGLHTATTCVIQLLCVDVYTQQCIYDASTALICPPPLPFPPLSLAPSRLQYVYAYIIYMYTDTYMHMCVYIKCICTYTY